MYTAVVADRVYGELEERVALDCARGGGDEAADRDPAWVAPTVAPDPAVASA
jgi:hypothetical protein